MNQYGNSHYNPANPGQYTPPTPPPQNPAPRGKTPWWVWALAIPGALLAGVIGLVNAGGNLAEKATAPNPAVTTRAGVPASTYDPGINTPEPTRAPSSTRKPPEEAPPTVPTDGTLLVGPDVKPGIYRATQPADAMQCYWARLRDLDGGINSIIDNDLKLQPGAVVTLRIRATDYAVEINCGGAQWKRISS